MQNQRKMYEVEPAIHDLVEDLADADLALGKISDLRFEGTTDGSCWVFRIQVKFATQKRKKRKPTNGATP